MVVPNRLAPSRGWLQLENDMFRQWLENRKTRRYEQRYRAGFAWAMTAYYLDAKSPKEIGNQVDFGIRMDGNNPFDEGAIKALTLI